MNLRIGAAVDLNDMLNGFRAVRRTGNVSLEFKLLHQLAAIREEVLYEVLLELRNPTALWTGSYTWISCYDMISDHGQRDSFIYSGTTS